MSVPRSHFDDLNNRVTYLEQVLRQLAEKFSLPEALEPSEGTPAWWVWAEKQADEEIQAGKGIELHTKADIERYFTTL